MTQPSENVTITYELSGQVDEIEIIDPISRKVNLQEQGKIITWAETIKRGQWVSIEAKVISGQGWFDCVIYVDGEEVVSHNFLVTSNGISQDECHAIEFVD